MNQLATFDRLESEVRSYCRSWPVVFERARGATMIDREGRSYVDFFAGAGALSYGHNEPRLQEAVVEYLTGDGIVHGLDMATVAKERFLATFEERILQPRGLAYKTQFPGPTGTNAVESALKLARKVTGRDNVVGFTNAFHGMTLGSLAVTGNSMKRDGAGVALTNAAAMPYEGFHGPDVDTIEILDNLFEDSGSGVDLPAAIIVETVQAEGGLNTASAEWMRRLAGVCREHEVLLVLDDIQVGCGRTGPFFSWEEMGIEPDLICLSKSISGYGLPMSIVLIRPELDVWSPGEHNGTFRGNNPAFVTATATLDLFWGDDSLTRDVDKKATVVNDRLEALLQAHAGLFDEVRGRGLIQGIRGVVPELAGAIAREAFELGLIIETSGPESEVVKLLPPLTIADEELHRGLDLLDDAVDRVVTRDAEELLAAADRGEIRQ